MSEGLNLSEQETVLARHRIRIRRLIQDIMAQVPRKMASGRNSHISTGTETSLHAEGINFQKLAEHMECPICLEVPLPPVFQCATGHHICNVCSKKVQQCGICKQPITETRNFFFERCFESTYFNCKYIQEGCTENQILGCQFEGHLKNCEFRDVRCLIGKGCGPIKRSTFVQHFRVAHKGSTCRLDEATGEAKLRFPVPSAFSPGNYAVELYDGTRSFFFRIKKRDSSVGMFLSIFGNSGDEKKFRSKITIGETKDDFEENTSICQSWEGPVKSIHADPDEVLNAGGAMMTTTNCLNAVAIVEPPAPVGCDGIFRIAPPKPQWQCTIQIKDIGKKSLSNTLESPIASLLLPPPNQDMDYDTDDSDL